MSTTTATLFDLWHAPGFPHRGWDCVHIEDLNPDNLPASEVEYATCEACGQHPVRFVHMLTHEEWGDEVQVGCVCAEKLTGDYANPRRHEADLRRRADARARWLTRKWKTSAKGNPWIKVDGRHITVFPSRFSPGSFCYCIDGRFGRETFSTRRAAMLASFDALHSATVDL